MKRHPSISLTMALAALFLVGISTSVSAQGLGPVHRFSAEFQFSPPGTFEILTTAPPAAGGMGGITVYSKTLFIPFRTLFVTIAAQGDVHNHTNIGGFGVTGLPNDNALLMTCVIDGVVCQAGGGLPDSPPLGVGGGPAGWVTLLKPPPLVGIVGGCNGGIGDGGGGGGDCHDNNIHYTWCTTVPASGTHTVELKLAAANGVDTVFYERSHIYIDGTPNSQAADRCVAAAPGPFTGTLP